MAKATSKDRNIAVTKIRQSFENFNRRALERSASVRYALSTLFIGVLTKVKRFDSDLMRRARITDASSVGISAVEIYLGLEYSNEAGEMSGKWSFVVNWVKTKWRN